MTEREIIQTWLQRGRLVQARVAAIQARAVSRNGELGVTVDAQGRVSDVRLTPRALELGDVRLGHLLVETLQRAQADAAKQVEEAWQPLTAHPAIREILDFGRDLTRPGQELRPPVNEDELSWEEQVHLQEERIRRQFRG